MAGNSPSIGLISRLVSREVADYETPEMFEKLIRDLLGSGVTGENLLGLIESGLELVSSGIGTDFVIKHGATIARCLVVVTVDAVTFARRGCGCLGECVRGGFKKGLSEESAKVVRTRISSAITTDDMPVDDESSVLCLITLAVKCVEGVRNLRGSTKREIVLGAVTDVISGSGSGRKDELLSFLKRVGDGMISSLVSLGKSRIVST